jgi:2'-5' RNA ligase
LANMPRYFLAFPLPDEAKDSLVAIQPATLPGMRLPGREDLHLTLHFIGEVSPQHAPVMLDALGRVRSNAFTIALRGVGKFPPDGQPRVLWAGVGHHPSLTALHCTIGAALTDAIGFQPESRPYSPHVTLAYLNAPLPAEAIARYLAGAEDYRLPVVPLARFALYTSDIVDDRPQYHEEATFALTRPE